MPSPEIQVLWTVPVGFVRVSDLIEKVDLVFWKEEGDRHRVYRCVAPSLSERQKGYEMYQLGVARMALGFVAFTS